MKKSLVWQKNMKVHMIWIRFKE